MHPMTPLDVLTTLVSILIVLSVSAERLVEIVKNAIPFLVTERADAKQEQWRKCLLQIMALLAGIATAFLAAPLLSDGIKQQFDLDAWDYIILGFLSSGGSGFWNAILGYLKGIKDLKQVQATATRTQAAAAAAPEARAKILR